MANRGGEASSSGGQICPFLGHFSTPALQMAFRASFGIPNDVQVNLVGQRVDGVATVQHGEGLLLIPLMAVFEGGVRFPLHPFLCDILRELKTTTSMFMVNFYRIVMSLVRLNERHNLRLTSNEFFGMYAINRNKKTGRYFPAIRKGKDYAVDMLPDADQWGGQFLSVTGNYAPPRPSNFLAPRPHR